MGKPSTTVSIKDLSRAEIDALVENGKFALDDYAKVYLAPTANSFELKPTGSVFRGINDLERAQAYADQVAGYFQLHGLDKQVFVVRGPTSTTRSRFEVVDATCGYEVLYKSKPIDVAEEQTALVDDAYLEAERPRGG